MHARGKDGVDHPGVMVSGHLFAVAEDKRRSLLLSIRHPTDPHKRLIVNPHADKSSWIWSRPPGPSKFVPLFDCEISF